MVATPKLTVNLGIPATVIAQTRAELILEMDCDFSHDPASVGSLIAACEGGADLAGLARKRRQVAHARCRQLRCQPY